MKIFNKEIDILDIFKSHRDLKKKNIKLDKMVEVISLDLFLARQDLRKMKKGSKS